MKNLIQNVQNNFNEEDIIILDRKLMINRFIKSMILSILFVVGFSVHVKAQFRFEVTNNTGCTYTITAYDAFSNTIGAALTANPGSSSYDFTGSTVIDHLVVTSSTCSPLTFGTGGVFSFSSQFTSCAPITCNKNINCNGVVQNGFCFGNYMYLVLNIN